MGPGGGQAEDRGLRNGTARGCVRRREFAGISVVRWAGRWQTSAVRLGVEWLGAGLRARPNFSCHGQLCGRCRVRRRAERVSRPAQGSRRTASRRVLVESRSWHRPVPILRLSLRARLCAITCIASQAPLAAKRPRRKMIQVPRRTSGLEWRSRPRRGGGGRPPAARVSPSRSVMKDVIASFRWRRGLFLGTGRWA